MATLFLLVGLPASGKTTLARKIASDRRALRMTPDVWMIPLFGESEANGKRDVLEGRLIAVALEALRLGTNVVLDFGFWARDERSALRSIAASVGASAEVVYLPIDRATQLQRVRTRWDDTPAETFEITKTDLDSWRGLFQEPTTDELAGGPIDEPPKPWQDWYDWAAWRWPSLSDS